MRKKLIRMPFVILAVVVLAAVSAVVVLVKQPVVPRGARPSPGLADAATLERHVRFLAEGCVPRDLAHPANLEKAAAYIEEQLRATGANVFDQRYRVRGEETRNLIAAFGPEKGPTLTVGAHYDAFGGLPGADDNASGTAGILELARLLAKEPAPKIRVELVAYTLEEPPHFRSEEMGSAVHAKSLGDRGLSSVGMIGLEMIGCFSDEPGSQTYPFPAMKAVYPSRGTFIALAGRPEDVGLLRSVKRAMARGSKLPVHSINAPPDLAPGIDLSDHERYWLLGMKAVMVTDTAFFRNARYHTPEDTPDTLDYVRMSKVVEGVLEAIVTLTRA